MASLIKGSIYKITNKVNGKVYIGQTIKDPNLRFFQHLRNASYSYSRSGISRSIKKYGKQSFDFEVICSCIGLDELNKQEMYFINKFNSLTPNGYNLNTGGKHYLRTTEITNKIVAKNTGKKRTLESRLRMSQAQLGKIHPHLRKRVKLINIKTGEEIILDKISDSYKYNIHRNSIGNVLAGKAKTAAGYFVEYIRKAG